MCLSSVSLSPETAVFIFSVFRSEPSQFQSHYVICLSPDNEYLFVADSGNNRVQVFCVADGAHVRSIGSKGSGPGQIDSAFDVCISPDGDFLFIADVNNHRVQFFSARDGHFLRSIPLGSARPVALCLSHNAQYIFVADSNDNYVLVVRASDGELLCTLGSEERGCRFSGPRCMTLSPCGDLLYCTDWNGNFVHVFTA